MQDMTSSWLKEVLKSLAFAREKKEETNMANETVLGDMILNHANETLPECVSQHHCALRQHLKLKPVL